MELNKWVPLLSLLGGVLGGLVFLTWAIISGFKKRSKIAAEALDKANAGIVTAHDGLIQVIREETIAWKMRYEGEHTEFLEYRNKTHEASQATTSKILQLTEENAELKSKTDLTPVMRKFDEQGQINAKVVEALDSILEHLKNGNGVMV